MSNNELDTLHRPDVNHFAAEHGPVDGNSRDEIVIARFGKKQQFKRGFGLLPVVGLTCTLMITWEVVTSTLLNGLENGGPAGLIYGFIFVWCGAILQGLVSAELASMIPLSGGPFNWVAILSPPSIRNFLSYLAGWLTVIGWQALVAGTAYVSGTLIQSLLILNYPEYTEQRWHGTLLYYAIISVSLFINTYLGRLLPQIESVMLFFHILGYFAVLIPIVYLAPKQSPQEVFTTFYNMGEWPTQGLSFFVGLISSMNSFPAEEVKNAPKVLPISMLTAVILNGAMGLGMVIALMFCMPPDIDAVLSSDSHYPFIGIYAYSLSSNSGATGLTCVVIVTQIFACVSVVATASRMLWAFAREGGVPFSKYIARIDKKTHLPLYAIGATTVLNLLLALINIGSTVGFTAFISLIVASYYSSFMLGAGCMLYARLTTPESKLPWGPFRLRKAGVPITVAALAYTSVGLFFSLWPNDIHPTPQSMNWAVLLYGASLLFAVFFWFVYGRSTYNGPIMELGEGSAVQK